MTDDLTKRLRSASDALRVSDEARTTHLAAIREALGDGSGAETGTVIPLGRRSRRRRVAVAIVAAALVGPTGLAAASTDALPGDTLFGVKQVTERVIVLFDDDVIARHRIEEAEALAASGRLELDAIERAKAALAELENGTELRARLETLTTASVELPDGSVLRGRAENGRLFDVQVPSGWTILEQDDDELVITDGSFVVEVDVHSGDRIRIDVEEVGDRQTRDDDTTDTSGADDRSDDDPSDGSLDDDTSESTSGSASDDDPSDDTDNSGSDDNTDNSGSGSDDDPSNDTDNSGSGSDDDPSNDTSGSGSDDDPSDD